MSNWTVTALKMGELTVEKSSITYMKDVGELLTIPVWIAAIEGNGMKILVDTGIHDPQWVRQHITPCVMKEEHYILNALEQGVGWTAEEVNIVINTHLHYDHCGNNRLFKNATFYVQTKEWIAAHSPIPCQETIYFNELYDSKAVSDERWKFVDGDKEIFPGIELSLTPGHSEGHQSVSIQTENGSICISGDVFNTLENMEENIPAGILTNTKEIFESMNKLRTKTKFVLPGHEPSIKNFQKTDFPKMKALNKGAEVRI